MVNYKSNKNIFLIQLNCKNGHLQRSLFLFQNLKFIFILFFILGSFSSFNSFALTKDTIPSWLDTIPPKVVVQPSPGFYSKVFHITLTSNEQAYLWMSLGNAKQFKNYKKPYSITRDGVYWIYYYGEDDFGNKSAVDSANFILDTKSPKLTVTPSSGHYPKSFFVKIKTDESCKLLIKQNPGDSTFIQVSDSFLVEKSFLGYIQAVDRAGNVTTSGKLSYHIDTANYSISVDPQPGIYNRPFKIALSTMPGIEIFYTFDPLAPPKWFKKYEGPVTLPYGLSLLRYYGKNQHGIESQVIKSKYVVDTIAPRLRYEIAKGSRADTLQFKSKDNAIIRYTLDGSIPIPGSTRYEKPIIIEHKGICLLKGKAWDEAGNTSEIVTFEYKYDTIPPVLSISPGSGLYSSPQKIQFNINEQARIFYTTDKSEPGRNSYLFAQEEILVSREDTTVIRARAMDLAGNWSQPQQVSIVLDTKAPIVKPRIHGDLQEKNYRVTFSTNEPCVIYYELNGSNPTQSSPQYRESIEMQSGQVLTYKAVDYAGNISQTGIMQELVKPMITAVPRGGIYNRKLVITFATNISGITYYRFLPDSIFRNVNDSVKIFTEGKHTLEYYFESEQGVKSPVKQTEYFLDWTIPRANISVKKGVNDSVSVFLDCTENSTIYYTLDGSNPFTSKTTKLAGNKYSQARDRISVPKIAGTKLIYFVEDLSGNQSSAQIVDVFRPRAVPNIPSGKDRIYDRILSVSFNTFDQASIYYARHGKVPTLDSTLFSEPLTLVQSDTIITFVIDASGYRGSLDTFIYMIDLPPFAQFTVKKDTANLGTPVIFDASQSIDKETPLHKLTFFWDFDGNGIFDTKGLNEPKISFNYAQAGNYKAILKVVDEGKRFSTYDRMIIIRDKCPDGMVSVISSSTNKSFCIDKYEYPNVAGREPKTSVSWVEAKMACIDAGKRLCSLQEWKDACQGLTTTPYPYGLHYDSLRCATQGKGFYKSGSFQTCNQFGVIDMVGNVWEWVEDKDEDYPFLLGGSYKYGKNAYCEFKTKGTMGTRAQDAGFRCCK